MSKDITVMGSGYVGLVASACLADEGNRVTCLDIDEQRVEQLNRGEIPIFEPGLEELIQRQRERDRISFTADHTRALTGRDMILIAVGTPKREDGSCDIRYVMGAAEMIGETIREDVIVVTKSTVPVGTGELIRERVNETIKPREMDPAPKVQMVSNPEFLREGSALEDFRSPDRVVVGSESESARNAVAELYEGLEAPIVKTGLRTAEMIKYASNAMLAAKISFINEIANVCELVGADVEQVADAMGRDHRINPRFLGAGIGYGGSCFPKDTEALVQIAGQGGYHSQILSAVMAVNQQQRTRFARKILRSLPDAISRPRVGILGLSFKPNTDDMREAPSVEIIQALQAEGVQIRAYDPVAMPEARKKLSGVHWSDSPYEAVEGVHAMALLTEWDEFLDLDFERVHENMETPIVFDGRNALPMQKMVERGFQYYGVGRGVDRLEDILPNTRLLRRDEHRPVGNE